MRSVTARIVSPALRGCGHSRSHGGARSQPSRKVRVELDDGGALLDLLAQAGRQRAQHRRLRLAGRVLREGGDGTLSQRVELIAESNDLGIGQVIADVSEEPPAGGQGQQLSVAVVGASHRGAVPVDRRRTPDGALQEREKTGANGRTPGEYSPSSLSVPLVARYADGRQQFV